MSQGEKKLAVVSLNRAVSLWPAYLKAVVRRAGLHEELGDLDDALQDYKSLLELCPGNGDALQAVQVGATAEEPLGCWGNRDALLYSLC